MALRKLIILSLIFLPLSLNAETASDYINRGAQKYIFGKEDLAKAEVEEGLSKFPNDPELKEMLKLFKDKKQPDQKNDQQKDQKDQQQQQQQPPQESNNGQSNKQENNGPSPTPSPDENQPQNGAGESPTPTPGSSPPENESPGASATPDDEGTPSPTPSSSGQPGAENGEQPSPTPAGTPGKAPTGEVKGAGDEKPKGDEQAAQAEVEPEKEGEMSPKQAQLLLESMKDEEQKVQLDEHKRARPVYNDW